MRAFIYILLFLNISVFAQQTDGEDIDVSNGNPACLSCDGLCPFVGIAFVDNAGVLEYTMEDGTLVSTPNNANISNFWANGSIEILNADVGVDEVVISFSNPVNLQVLPAIQPTTRINWHENSATARSWFQTNGSDWELTIGTAPSNVFVNGNIADTQAGEPVNGGVDANADWGILQTCNVTELRIASNVYDLWNFNVQSLDPTCCKDVCTVIEELRKDIVNASGGSTVDENTEYTFNYECEDSGLKVEIEDNQGNTIVDDIVDLSCHILNVMQNFIDDLQDHIDDDEVLNCVDVNNCLPADLQDGDDIGIIEDIDLVVDCANEELFLSIDVGGVQETATQDISCLFDNTDDQTLSLSAANILSIEDGNSVDLSGFISPPNLDNDPTNELDDTDISGVDLTLVGTVLTTTVTEDLTAVSDNIDLSSLQDGNTEYKYDLTCDGGSLLFEVFSSDGNTDDAIKVDLQDCINVNDADSDPTNEIQTLTTTFQDRCHTIAYAFVNANGTIAQQSGGMTVVRLSTGRYTYAYAGPETDIFYEVTVVEGFTTRDDIQAYPENFAGSTQYLVEQDNGGTAGVPRDRPHRVLVKGVRSELTNVTISN